MYRTICAELWTDPAIKSLDVPTKLLFVYLITNPHTHLCGIYYLPEETALRETGLKKIPYRYGIDTLSKLDKAHFDPHTETIFVVNMFEYQGQGPKNEACASKHLETLHNSCLIPQFLSRYPRIPYRYPIQSCPSVPVPVLLTSSPKSESDLKSNHHSKKSNGAREFPDDFVFDDTVKSNWAAHGIDPGIEFAKFRDHHKARATKFSDWKAAWRNWARNAIKFKEESHVRPVR